MTDTSIANQLITSTRLVAIKALREKGEALDENNQEQRAWLEQVAVAYLSGCNQTANFLIRNDGGVTPQQIERALLLAGEQFGFSLVRPEHLKNVSDNGDYKQPEGPAQ